MKFNLKNRPNAYEKGSMPYLPLGSEWEKYFAKLEEWFEGFEEEIRSRLAWLTPDMDKTMMSCRDFRRFMEEILGDKIAEIEGEE